MSNEHMGDFLLIKYLPILYHMTQEAFVHTKRQRGYITPLETGCCIWI